MAMRDAAFLTALALFVSLGFSFASEGASGALAWLENPVGARAVALGGTCAAARGSVTMIALNPAGLTKLRTLSIGAEAERLFGMEGSLRRFAGLSVSLGAVGLGAAVQGIAIEGEGYTSEERVLRGAAAIAFGDSASLGVTVNYYTNEVDLDGYGSSFGSGFGIDLGASLSWQNLVVGCALRNIGAVIDYGAVQDTINFQGRLGVALRLFGAMLIGADLVIASENRLGLGIEYFFIPEAALRFGGEIAFDGGAVISAGAGVRFAGAAVDLGYSFYAVSGYHQLALSAELSF